jgi:hypothetical protein
MNSIEIAIKNVDMISLIIGSIITIILTLLIQYLFPQLFRKIILLLKNKYFSHEQILGGFYGYYLHKDNKNSEIILKESHWKISADFQKEHYFVTIYDDDSKGKKVLYKGKMWIQGNHYLLQFNSLEYKETIFERKIIPTKANEYPIVGIGLAITPQGKARSCVSMLSKKKLSLNDFYRIAKEHEILFEKETFNLKIK